MPSAGARWDTKRPQTLNIDDLASSLFLRIFISRCCFLLLPVACNFRKFLCAYPSACPIRVFEAKVAARSCGLFLPSEVQQHVALWRICEIPKSGLGHS